MARITSQSVLDLDQRFEVFDLASGRAEAGIGAFFSCPGKISLALTFPEDVLREVCDASEQQETGVTELNVLCVDVMPDNSHQAEMFTITR